MAPPGRGALTGGPVRRTTAVLTTAGALAVLAVAAVALAAGDGPAGPGPRAVPTTPAADPGAAGPSPSPSAAPTPAGGTLVMWARADLPASVARRAGTLEHVAAAAFVRSDTLGLTGSRSAAGRPVDTPPEGFRIPVDVAAVDPGPYARVLPAGAARDAVASLEPGAVLLSETSHRLRGIGRGGRVDLVGRPGLAVAGVVPDGTVGRAEIILHAADADAAGLGPDGTLVLRHRAGPDRVPALRGRVRALAPGDTPARVVGSSPAGRQRAPLVLSLAEVKARFGEFSFRPVAGARTIDLGGGFSDRHIVTAEVPLLGTVRCHEAIVPDLRAALEDVVAAGHGDWAGPASYAGCFHPRRITGSGRLSHHSWGIAIDINVDASMPAFGPRPPRAVVAAFERHGFRWGGDFIAPDNPHFEWLGPEADRPLPSAAP